MKYLSTRDNSLNKSFQDTLFEGLSSDGGLFLPKVWPQIDVNSLSSDSYQHVALKIILPYLKEEISENDLYNIINLSYKNFKHNKIAPLVNIDENKYILELFYGPTFAFKDYALQFLGNLFNHFVSNKNKKIVVIGATSGDTGSAAIEAFKGKNDIKVFILHPYNKVSEVQRRQMTTVSEENIFNIAVEGTFDDCQKIVKTLFLDKEIKKRVSLTAINSINWSRIIAQAVYYFWSFKQLDINKINFIVPSGNFGNIFSARVAMNMGLPVENLYLVTNQNDILHRIISKGDMKINNVQETYSPSMDIQISSNFERELFENFNRNSEELKKIMNIFIDKGSFEFDNTTLSKLQKIYISESVSDETTLATIKLFNDKYNYLADPHTATGLSVLDKQKSNFPSISLACAHPAKFGDAIMKAIGKQPSLPSEINKIFDKKENVTILPNNTENIKKLILNKI